MTGRKILSCCFSLKLRSSAVGWQPGTVVDFLLCVWFSDKFSFSFLVWLHIHLVTEVKLIKTETLLAARSEKGLILRQDGLYCVAWYRDWGVFWPFS